MDTKIIEVEAGTLEEAREQVKSQIPEGLRVLSENIVSDGKPKTIRAVADTAETAFTKAQTEIPNDANILEKKELTAATQKATKVEAFDEQSARAQLTSQIGNTAIIKAFKLITSGKQGFLGIGKQPNQYEAEVFQQSVVEITYQMKAKISAKVGKEEKTIATVLRDFLVTHEDEISGLGGMDGLAFIDLTKSIVDNDGSLSVENIQKGLQHRNPKMRVLFKKYIEEVQKLLEDNDAKEAS